MLDTIKRKIQSQSAQDIIASRLSESVPVLNEGEQLIFCAMDVDVLSRAVATVGKPVNYHFSSNIVTAYPLILGDGSTLCRLVVAIGGDDGEPYLALSQHIDAERAQAMCTAEDYDRLLSTNCPRHLYIREQMSGCREWMHIHYERMIAHTPCLVGDTGEEGRHSIYSLYGALKDHKALEIERTPEGKLVFYATIFRPLSNIMSLTERSAIAPSPADIGSALSHFAQQLTKNNTQSTDERKTALAFPNMARAAKAEKDVASVAPVAVQPVVPEPVAANNNKEAPVSIAPPPTPKNAPDNMFYIDGEDNLPAAPPKLQPVDLSHGETSQLETDRQKALEPAAPIISMPSLAMHKDNKIIQCNMHTASSLIALALKDDRHVSDIVRRALGLSVVEQGRVSFDVRLSEDDYAALADRFGVDSDDVEAIHDYIVEELEHFTDDTGKA